MATKKFDPNLPKQPENPQFTIWHLYPPPATRFYQWTDGAIHLYFETNRILEMVEWAENNLEHFRSLARSKGFQVTIKDQSGNRKALEMDDGYKIALRQQQELDKAHGIDREAKNNAPDEPEDQPENQVQTDESTSPTLPPEPPDEPPVVQ